MSVAPPGGQDRIMIYGPKSDGTYIIEFRMADGESLAISVPAGETRVLKHFQARMPYITGCSCRTFVRNIHRDQGVSLMEQLPGEGSTRQVGSEVELQTAGFARHGGGGRPY